MGFSVKLVDGEYLNFGGECNKVNYQDNKLCRFIRNNEGKGTYTILAMIPYDRITYILNEDNVRMGDSWYAEERRS